MPFSTTYANNILSWVMGKSGALSGHTQVWIGLSTNDPDADNGIFTELSGKGYARVLVNQYNQDYPGLIANASNRVIANGKQIGFTKATGGDWSTVKGYGLFTNATGGTPYYYAKLKEPVDTPEGAIFLFDPGELKIGFHTTDIDIEDITE